MKGARPVRRGDRERPLSGAQYGAPGPTLRFDEKDDAYGFRRQVRLAYQRGRDLNLVHWDTVAID